MKTQVFGMTVRLVGVVGLSFSIFACSSGSKEPTGVLPEAHKQALKKAEQVEDVMQNREQALRETLEKANKAE